MDIWVNNYLRTILKIQKATPCDIFRYDCKIESLRIQLLKRKFKMKNKLIHLNYELLSKNLSFPKKQHEKINWEIEKNINILKIQIKKSLISSMKRKTKNPNGKNWKLKNYLKIIDLKKEWKQQKYLDWKSSSMIFKLRSFSNGLNRYSYVMKDQKDKKCLFCQNQIEDIDHFLWYCPKYNKSRNKWIKSSQNNKQFNKILTNKQTFSLLSNINDKYIYEKTSDFIRRNWKNRAD